METLGNVLWTTLEIFVLVAYLMILFFILSDMFRDHDLSGWWKALFIVAFIIFPFLSVVIYLIVRGPGMQRRARESAEQMQKRQADYIRQTAAKPDPTEQIAKAKQLHDQGVVSDAEFEKLKAKALA